ncbi:MAG: NUDIX domain-containing protein [Defluviitaleaceae bacterium]|nr:NUDIX domain-containing protein [Defluviitaleaceae bacterium]
MICLTAGHADHSGLCYLVGGTVNIHETSEEAVIREVYEEIVTNYYLMKAGIHLDIAEGSFTDQPPSETLHWLPLDDLASYNLVPQFLKSRKLDGITSIEHIIRKEH